MAWEVIPIDGEVYVVPQNDEMQHQVIGFCPCRPRHEVVVTGGLLVIHDAIDGRLGIEWAADILSR